MSMERAASVQVVRLHEAQADAAAALIGRAFQDDPLFVHACPDPGERARWLPQMFRWSVWRGLLSGQLLGTADQLDGVASMTRPGAEAFTAAELARVDYDRGRQIVGAAIWDRAMATLMAVLAPAEAALQQAVPEPHWYLDVIAVEPAAQGHGIGRALLRAVEAHADAEAAPLALLVTNTTIAGFYQRSGYAVVWEATVVGSGVHWGGMRRDPAGVATRA